MTKENIIKNLKSEIINENDGNYVDVQVPEQLGRQLSGYHSMFIDLSLCVASIERLKDNELDNVTKACYWNTIITLYSKCFTDATHEKFPKLEPKDLKLYDYGLIDRHNQLMSQRNSLTAHRGSSEFDVNYVYASINLTAKTQKVHVKWYKTHQPNQDELDNSRSLINHALKEVKLKMFKISGKIETIVSEYSQKKIKELKINIETPRSSE